MGVDVAQQIGTAVHFILGANYFFLCHSALEFKIFKMAGHGIEHFAGVGNHTAHTAEVIYRHCTFYCKAHILYHLSGIELYCEYTFYTACQTSNLGSRERPKCYRADKADIDAFSTGILDSLEADTGDRTEGYNQIFRHLR